MAHITNKNHPANLPLDLQHITTIWLVQRKNGAMPATWADTAYTGGRYEEAAQHINKTDPDRRIVRRRVYHLDEVVRS